MFSISQCVSVSVFINSNSVSVCMCTKYFAVCICILYLSVETVRALIQDTKVACAELIINCLCLHLDLMIASEVVKLRQRRLTYA